jgi:hypothetical protein
MTTVVEHEKVFARTFDQLTVYRRHCIAVWCSRCLTALDPQGKYNWWVDGNTFLFRCEKDHMLFVLAWCE